MYLLRIFCSILLFSSLPVVLKANPCLTVLQLTKLQSVKVAEREKFLSRENYYKKGSGNGTNETMALFGYQLEYAVTTYQCNDYPYGVIDFYESPGLPVFLVFKTNYGCQTELQEKFNSKSSKDINTSTYSGKDFKQDNLTFSFRNYRDNSNKNYCVLIYNTQIIKAELQDLMLQEEKRKQELQAIQDEYYAMIKLGDSLQTNGEYSEAIQFYQDALKILDDDLAKNRIQQCKTAECNSLMRHADDEFESGNYLTAIEWYNRAKECPVNFSKSNSKIAECESRILKSRIQEIKSKADAHYDAKRYNQAKETYNRLLDIEPDNLQAKSRIKEINELQAFLTERKTKIYDYASKNSTGFNALKTELTGHLNQLMEKNSGGQLVYDFNIEFDTLGQNITSHTISKSTFRDYNSYLTKSHNFSGLTSISNKGYFIAAQSKISMSATWNTSRVEYLSNARNSKFVGTSTDYPEIKGFVQRQSIDKGKFTFDVKEKQFNGKRFRDIYLVDYKTKAGPEYSLLSLLYPGVGSLKVSHGEKGLKRMIWFTVLGATSYALHVSSVNYYNKYLGSSTQSQMNDNYLRADVLHKSAIVFGGFAATFYLYDFFWAFGRGCKNEINSKGLKSSRNDPYQVVYQRVD